MHFSEQETNLFIPAGYNESIESVLNAAFENLLS
jgi:hypothetical protein